MIVVQGFICCLEPFRRAPPPNASRSSRRACTSSRSTSRSSSRGPAGASLGSPGLRTRSRSSSCGSCRPLCQGHRACSNSSSCRGRRPCNSRLGSCSSSRLRWRLRSRACRAPGTASSSSSRSSSSLTASSHCISSSRSSSSWATPAACPSTVAKCRAPCSCPLPNRSSKPLGRPGQSPWRHLGSHVSSLFPGRSRCGATPLEILSCDISLCTFAYLGMSWAFRAGDTVTDEAVSVCSQSRSHRPGSSICSDHLCQLLYGRLCRWGLHLCSTLSSLVPRCSASPERPRLNRLHS